MNYSLSILYYVKTTVNLKFGAVTMKGTRFSTQTKLVRMPMLQIPI